MRSPLIPGHGGRLHRRRLLALIAAPALGLSLLAATPSPAVTTDDLDETAAPDAPVADFESLTGDAGPVAVTLITGDTVLWSDPGDGSAGVYEIEEAPRDYAVTYDQSGTEEDFYVIPSDVMPRVVEGTLDRELFNIPGLIDQGLDDVSTGAKLPVIVTFEENQTHRITTADVDADALARRADALPATGDSIGVEGIRGAGVSIDRERAAAFRDAVLTTTDSSSSRGPSTTSHEDLGRGIEKILLDQMLQIDLSESVPQIGASQAWEAGYTGEGVTVAVLDTGVDATHPDLEGQVIEQVDFTGQGDLSDAHGHGTHVASTIAGTGAASDGQYTGVAPDADLLSGKVCNARGRCFTSVVMAGMEWAANSGADIVNMSLGSSEPSDGTDIQSKLLNELSAETGILFVTSAGNAGEAGLRWVGSPGAADAALAVGAVDKSDQIADFSSRGPRITDHAVKPELTAPGVDIVAARAEGTSRGDPVDDVYTSLNGTSMASPHVAGAAALLTQAQPDLDGAELKDALVSTAVDGGHRWYEQGTGRVDVSSALNSPIYASGTVNIGGVEGQAAEDLVYSNHSEQDITLSLDAAVTETNGFDTDAAGVTLSTDTLTVPANGTASVTITATVAADVSPREAFGGVVAATGDGVDLRTGLGFGQYLPKVTIEVLDSNGDRIGTDTAPDDHVVLTHDTWDPESGDEQSYRVETSDGIAVQRIPAGIYTIIAGVEEYEPGAPSLDYARSSFLVEVEVDIAADTRIVLDARDAVPIEQPQVPRKAQKRSHGVVVTRELVGAGGSKFSETFGSAGDVDVYATPAPPGKLAPVGLFVKWTLAEPQAVQPKPWDMSGLCPFFPHRCYSETPSYVYNLPILYENGIPSDLHKRVTRSELIEVPTYFHSDQADALIEQQFTPSLPRILLNFTASNSISFRPGKVTEYYLANDHVSWRRTSAIERSPDGEPAPGGPAQIFSLWSWDWFPIAEAGDKRPEERWFDGPVVRMGMLDLREEALDSPSPPELRAWGSRNGPNGEWFAVPSYLRGNFRGTNSSSSIVMATSRMWNTDIGRELENTDQVLFPLSPGTATYRLEQVVELPASFGLATGREATTWTFTSSPSDMTVPQGHRCVIQQAPREDVCQIQPLIMLEYDLGLDIHNRAKAGRAHRFTITAGHHSKAIDRAKVTDLRVEASFDDGATWTDARVIGKPKDTWDTGGFLPSAEPYQEFKVVLKIPPLHRTDGFVALRVQAEDANGGTVEQTIHRAYVLKPPDKGVTGRER